MEKAEEPSKPPEPTSPLQRELALAQLIQNAHSRNPKSISVTLDLKTISGNEFLSDTEAFKRALNQLRKALGRDFQFDALSQGRVTSVVDVDVTKLPSVLYAYKITLDDWSTLATHIAVLEEKTKSLENQFSFYLIDVSPHQSELRLVGSDVKAPRMRKNLRRYKILHYLVEQKGKVTTAELADEFDVNEDVVRNTVTAIKDVVEKVYDIPRGSIFENDSSGDGYSVSNIELK